MTHSTWIKNLKTPIAIIGLGKSGKSALRLLQHFGFTEKQILLFDNKDPAATVSSFDQLVDLQPQTLVVSPGVPLQTKQIQVLISKGAFLTSEISIAASLLTTEKVLGVTGSVGKSTVTSLLGEGARCEDPESFVGGNLGVPFCDYAYALATGKPKAQWVVLELSSYQLENCNNLKLAHSAVTFLSSNHLERYENLDSYYQTKLKITSLTSGRCFFNLSSPDAVAYAQKSECPAVLVNSKNFFNPNLLSKINLIGEHNKDNFSIAAAIAKVCNWGEESFSAMTNYKGLPHRLEFVGNIDHVLYINDSKATAMDSVLVAVRGCLEKVKEKNNLYVLLGGKDKNLPWEQLAALGTDKRNLFVFFGACGMLAKEKSKLPGTYFSRLGEAVEYCQKKSLAGDTVLLSPGGTSLDEFKNFEERGDYFKRLVLENFEA